MPRGANQPNHDQRFIAWTFFGLPFEPNADRRNRSRPGNPGSAAILLLLGAFVSVTIFVLLALFR